MGYRCSHAGYKVQVDGVFLATPVEPEEVKRFDDPAELRRLRERVQRMTTTTSD
jgi:hypothetical protein